MLVNKIFQYLNYYFINTMYFIFMTATISQFNMQNALTKPTFSISNFQYAIKQNRMIQISTMIGLILLILSTIIVWITYNKNNNISLSTNILLIIIILLMILGTVLILFNFLVENIYITSIYGILSMLFLTKFIPEYIEIPLLILVTFVAIIVLYFTGTPIDKYIFDNSIEIFNSQYKIKIQ